ncbi:MAG: MBL fold metallo-hydrolase [Candidatus Zixiibacteriota bacterium]|nr:MAG: MBL fold metallo-hydrolase [candidate division Zixibacteria bacterium]
MIEYKNGIHISGTGLWLDAQRRTDFCFVSHAHADHAVRHTQILATRETARLFEHRYGKANFKLLEYNQSKRLNGIKVELFPSGHILGGAQILIEKAGTKIVYTGDFKLRKSLTAQKAQVRKCDILIMESTFGRPHLKFPPSRQVHDQMEEFAEETLTKGRVPVFLAYSLGKAQEAMKILSNRGFKLSVHGTIYNMARIYEEFGVRFKNYEHYQAGNLEGKVLIAPPSVRKSHMIENIPRKRMTVLTGWAMDKGTRYFNGVDEAIPLSDHADFPELLEYVRKAQPKKVYTVHGFAELVQSLREKGFDAEPLRQTTKIESTFSKELLTNYDLFA